MKNIIQLFILFLFCDICLAIESDVDIKVLRKNLKSKDKAVVYQATAYLAAYYRRNGELPKAERLLKNYQSPSGFDRMPPKEAIPFMRCLLETAHIRALNKDVPGSLKLLNWAEGRKRDYERAVGCLKYANILLDLNEPDRAEAYLNNVKKIVKLHYKEDTDTGAAIGQGSKVVDTGAAWRALQDQADYVAACVEELQMNKKFGATYGLYVKLRRLQNIVKRSATQTGKKSRYYNEAMKLCDEIIKADPKSQFAVAAGYLKGQLLFTVIPDQESKQQKKQIAEAKKYLEKFISDDKDGLYRGEAWMLLGKIALEKEWNAKASEKYYSEALKWFKAAREKRDALSLYASMDEKLKTQTLPTQKSTTLDKWKRIVYHPEDPLKLYNTGAAPIWYFSDKEKDCIYALGFIAFSIENFDIAKKYWKNILDLSPEIAKVDQRLPNVQTRLLKSCKLKAMMFWPEEKKGIKDENIRLQLQYGEFLQMVEKFDKAGKLFSNHVETNDMHQRAVFLLAMAQSADMLSPNKKTKKLNIKICDWVLNQKKLYKTPIYAKALYYKSLYMISGGLRKIGDALPYLHEYVNKFPKGRYIFPAKAKIALCYLKMGKLAVAKRLCNDLSQEHKGYAQFLEKVIARYEKHLDSKKYKYKKQVKNSKKEH